MLTMMGDSFPGRVGASLLSALSSRECDLVEILVTYSPKEFVERAVHLLRFPAILRHVREHLIRMSRNNRGLFDSASSSRAFYRSMFVVKNVKAISSTVENKRKRPHIIVND